MFPNRSRRQFGAVAFIALVALATACGSGGTKAAATSTTTTTTTTAGRRAAAQRAFTDCMKSHGVAIPARGLRGAGANPGDTTPTTGGTGSTTGSSVAPSTLPPGVTQQQYDDAIAACRSLIPARQASPAAAAYRNCINLQLQQHGATTLPPIGQGGGGGNGGGGGDSTATTNPALQAAMQACAALRPASAAATTTTRPVTTS